MLQHKVLFSYCLFMLALLFSSRVIAFNFSQVLGYATNIFSVELLRDTNTLRAENGLLPLQRSAILEEAAKAKARHMFENDYWAHTSPDGKEPWDFIVASGYEYSYAGENLAVDFDESQEVVKAWEKSHSHRANLLNPNYLEIGFAIMDGELQGRKTTLVVQMFGKPMHGSIASLPGDVDSQSTTSIEVGVPETSVSQESLESLESGTGGVLNASTVFDTSRAVAILLGLFLTLLFVVDLYYVKNMEIFRVSGNTFFHAVILLLAVIGIWYTNIGLVL